MKRARLLAFVVTAAMATTVFLGGTVARYQTTASIEDSATVAKWGVKLTMAGNLYGYNYTDENEAIPNKPTSETDDDKISVKSTNSGEDRVAPGTNGDILTIKLSGETEVDVAIDVNATAQDIYLVGGSYAVVLPVEIDSLTEYNSMMAGTDDTTKLYVLDSGVYRLATSFSAGTYYVLQNYVTFSETYYPVTYTYKIGSATQTKTKITEIANDIQTKLDGQSVPANTELSTIVTSFDFSSVTIEWAWELTNTHTTTKGNVNDLDTILGALSGGTMTVVKLNASSKYEVLTVDANKLVSCTSTADAGSVKTFFDITVEVSQAD